MKNYEMLLDKIVQSSGLEKSEIERKIEAKKAKLSGLISKEGAAQIIAAELGVSFENLDAKIGELIPGMRKVNVIGKVINLFPVREFSKNNREGKVVNFILADETGNIRIVLWDINHIGLIEEGKIKEGTVVEIKNGSMRESEMHLGSFSEISVSDKVIENVKTERVMLDKTIEEIQPGQGVRVRGTVVQIFNPRFFNVCPECGRKVVQGPDGFSCETHGKVQQKERSLINFVLDDGTETIRVVLFSDELSKLISEEDLKNPDKLLAFRDDFLGSEIWLQGLAKKNQLFGNLEISGQSVEKVDFEKLIAELGG